jgi:Tat protein secretion system quality control protein TatD with DNase activity
MNHSSNVQALMWCVGELGLDYLRFDVGHRYGGTDSEAARRRRRRSDWLNSEGSRRFPTAADFRHPAALAPYDGRKTSSNVQALMWCVGELGLDYLRFDVGHRYGGTHSDAPRRTGDSPTQARQHTTSAPAR